VGELCQGWVLCEHPIFSGLLPGLIYDLGSVVALFPDQRHRTCSSRPARHRISSTWVWCVVECCYGRSEHTRILGCEQQGMSTR